MLNQMSSNQNQNVFTILPCFSSSAVVYLQNLDQGNPLLKFFSVAQNKCQGLTMSQEALCHLSSITHLLPTPFYSFLNCTDKPQPQSLALPLSFVWNVLFMYFFDLLSFSSGLYSGDICCLAFVIILYKISNHPPSTQASHISQAFCLIISKALIII